MSSLLTFSHAVPHCQFRSASKFRTQTTWRMLSIIGFGVALFALNDSAQAQPSPSPPQRTTVREHAPVVDGGRAADDPAAMFRRENLVAWCIVPFDSRKRSPEQRAEMLAELGFRHFAYDYRAEHIPSFAEEIAECRKRGIEFTAWWFPGELNDEARQILDLCRREKITPQLWVTGSGSVVASPSEQQARIEAEANRIRPIALAAAAQGQKVALYNHGGWFGEPENQIAVINHLQLPNVGIVYNFHHGHSHVQRFAELFATMLPHLLAVNMNGMTERGDERGKKILQLGQGEQELEMLRVIRDSGYDGLIGVIGHTDDDAAARLRDNLAGLDWLCDQLRGKPVGAPKPLETPLPQPENPAVVSGYRVAGRSEYSQKPFTAEVRATLRSQTGYNILVANHTKASADHWELFSVAGSGHFSLYIPGYQPDHVHTGRNICDGKPHSLGLIFEPERVRLLIDSEVVADRPVTRVRNDVVAGELAIGRLVEGGFGCDGSLDYVQLRSGTDIPTTATGSVTETAADTIGLWRLAATATGTIADDSPLKNPAIRIVSAPPAATATTASSIPPGPQLRAMDERLQVKLIDRTPDEVYLGVKVDVAGNVFVGGRTAVFVWDSRGDGSYRPRHRLLQFPPDSIIMGLEFLGDDLYVLTDNALYLVPGGRTSRRDLHPQRILWGLPLDLHVSFHCLAWGPDGRLYLTHGDPLLNYGDWRTPDHWGHWTLFAGENNTAIPYTGQGAVLSIQPDGTDLRVVARGLRGPVGLAFDSAGRLFTNDNDHESRADQYAPARLLHVLPGIDFGWPRGWMASRTPDRKDLVDSVVNSLGRGVPCDLQWYRHPLFADVLPGRLLMCRWDRHAVTGYELQPKGVSVTAIEQTVLQGKGDCRPVGCGVAPDGTIFVTSLFMAGNQAAPECVSELVVVSRTSGNPPAGTHLDSNTPPTTRRRLAGNISEQQPPTAVVVPHSAPLPDFTNPELAFAAACSTDLHLRQVAVAALSETATASDLTAWLKSSNPAARLAAVLIMGHQLTVPAADSVPDERLKLFYPDENPFFKRKQRFYGSESSVDLAELGRIGSYTIAEKWATLPHSQLEELLFEMLTDTLRDPDGDVRLQAAYALSLLHDSRTDPLLDGVRNEVRYDRLRSAAKVDVDRYLTLGPVTDLSSEQSQNLFLGDFTGNVNSAQDTSGKPLAWTTVAEAAAVDRPVGIRFKQPTNVAVDQQSFIAVQLQSRSRQFALLRIEGQTDAELQTAAKPVPPIAGPAVIESKQPAAKIPEPTSPEPTTPEPTTPATQWIVSLQPGTNLLRMRLKNPANVPWPALRITLQAADTVEAVLPETVRDDELASRLKSASSDPATSIPPEFLELDWSTAAISGDAATGRKLFGSIGCAKCHAIAADQELPGAPSLQDARKRFTSAYLVESVLVPARSVAEPFRGSTLLMEAGQTVSGLVTSESATELELLLSDGTRKRIAVADVAERTAMPGSTMPHGLVKTPDELRHLLAYLLSENPTPP